MPFFAKLALFFVGLYLAMFLLAWFPDSRISRLAFSWHGPVPVLGERKSRFMLRQAVYALSWLAQVVFLFALGYLLTWWRPALADETWFMALWAFALPIFGGIALLGAFMAAIAALKAKVLGPNPPCALVQYDNQA